VSSVFALTAKIGNPRAILYADVTPSNPAMISRTLEVINVNDLAVNIMMDVSENCKDIIKLNEAEITFSLQPGQSKNVPFLVKVVQPGFYECKVNTYFKNIDDKGAGVALASTVIINAKGEGPDVPPETNNIVTDDTTPAVQNDTSTGITGGVSVNPGGKPDIGTKPGYNVFAISFFVLILVIVILLAFVVMKRRRK